jgi:TatD DNase family protein
MLVDSHCHLDYLPAGPEREAAIARARQAGVGAMLTIGTKITEFPEVRAIAEAEPDVWCSVGIHPHEAAAEPETSAEALARLAQHPRVIGIGETGLDFYYEHSPRDRQASVFRTHAEAAGISQLPLIVHTRDADRETAEILAVEAGKRPLTGVIHCFSTGRELAEKAIELGFLISLSGIVTFRNAEPLRQIVRDLPLDRILVETDSPYLAPVPKRGKPNEPSFLVHTAEEVARLKGVSAKELAAATTANFYRLFAKARPSVPTASCG